jgi:DNA-binding MarR family transcriptional regulator
MAASSNYFAISHCNEYRHSDEWQSQRANKPDQTFALTRNGRDSQSLQDRLGLGTGLPDSYIGRLLDHPEARDMVSRTRAEHDRRVMIARINDGLKLLACIDSPVRGRTKTTIAHLLEKCLRPLIDLPENIREHETTS